MPIFTIVLDNAGNCKVTVLASFDDRVVFFMMGIVAKSHHNNTSFFAFWIRVRRWKKTGSCGGGIRKTDDWCLKCSWAIILHI